MGKELVSMGDLQTQIAAVQNRARNVLPDHLPIEKQSSYLMMLAQAKPKLLECRPDTIVSCFLNACAWGLAVGGSRPEVHLIPSWNRNLNGYGKGGFECRMEIDYRAKLKMIRQHADVIWADAKPVYERDEIAVEYGPDGFLRHKPAMSGKRGAFVGAWAAVKHPSGMTTPLYMTKEELDPYRERTSSRNKSGEIVGPWKDDPTPMYVKTVIHRLANLLDWETDSPVAQEQALAVRQEAGASVVDVATRMPDVPELEGQSKEDRVLAVLEAHESAKLSAEGEASAGQAEADGYPREEAEERELELDRQRQAWLDQNEAEPSMDPEH